MGQEILYTSAPQGLRQGSSGYCTVNSTPGMEPNLAEFLEGFSGYPHPFKPPDPRTKDNPVNFSHIHWTIGGQRYHVLSRVSDAGLDYTGRTNLLAHHVALTRREVERCTGGPAWVMSHPKFFTIAWDGQLRTVPGAKPREDDSPLAKCVNWEQAAGDAGYAGLLAEAQKEKGGRPVTVIYPAEIQVLPLVLEALSLLPPERRWSVTYATFYSRIYSSFDVQWRFLFNETTDARQARRDPHSLVIDLCKGTLPKAEGGELVTVAREGRAAQRAAAIAPSRSAPAQSATSSGRRARPSAPASGGEPSEELTLAPPVFSAAGTAEPAGAGQKVSPFARARRKSVLWHYGLAFAGGISLAVVAALLFIFVTPPPTPVVAVPAPVGPQLNVGAGAVSSTGRNTGADDSIGPIETGSAVVDTPPPMPVEVAPPMPIAPAPLPTPAIGPVPTTIPTPSGPRKDPFADIEKRNRRLPLPKKQLGGPVQALAEVYVSAPNECDLELVGKETAFGKDAPLIVVKATDKPDSRSWAIVRNPAGTAGKEQVIGTFSLAAESLKFQWNASVPPSARPEALRYCLLKILVGAESQVCTLTEPQDIKSLILTDKPVDSVELPRLDERALPEISALRLEVVPRDLHGHLEPDALAAIAPGQSLRMRIRGGPDRPGPIIEYTVAFAFDADSKQKRAIDVKSRVAYRWPDHTSDDQAFETLNLTCEEVGKHARDRAKVVSNYDLDVKRADTELKKNERLAENQKKVIREEIARLRNSMSKEEDKKQKEVYQKIIEQRQKDMDEMAKEIGSLKGVLAAEEQKRDDEQQIVKAYQAALQLIEEVTLMGKLEFRIYVEVESEKLELFRTKGFPQTL